MAFYLTDTIFIENEIYFHEKNGKSVKINERDWHIHLNEYGWCKLNIQWIKKLNKLTNTKIKKNSRFGVLDCGEDGDCLFNCINYAINGEHNLTEDFIQMRKGFSEGIKYEHFRTIISIYQASKLSGDFEEDWDPFSITFDDFKKKVMLGGNDYWGDFLILNLIKEYLNVNFVVLYTNDITHEYYNYPLFYNYNKALQTIILLYENENHFKLVGHFSNHRMNFLFRGDIPNEILKLIGELR